MTWNNQANNHGRTAMIPKNNAPGKVIRRNTLFR